MPTIEVSDIRRLRIGPGEALLVTVPAATHPEAVSHVKAVFVDALPSVRVIVMTDSVDVRVVAQED